MSLPPPQLENSWKEILHKEWTKPYLSELVCFLAKERASSIVFPPKQEVFNAFQYTPFLKTNVVIIGQDPYHGPNQAQGLSFSVRPNIPFPPSLKNIFKELKEDVNIPTPAHGCLIDWAKQGVLLLNNVLTVRANEPRSHAGIGWEQFTDAVVTQLCEREDPVIFVLWGKDAQEKCRQILETSQSRHFILTAPHPSPFSAHTGFLGCRHFSKINDLLKRQGKPSIDWAIK